MSNPNPTRVQSLAEVIASVRASKLSDADKDEICAMMTLLETPAEEMTFEQLRLARLAAGLSVGQAARLLWIEPDVLREVEAGFPTLRGIGCWQPGLWARMNHVYRLGPPEDRA